MVCQKVQKQDTKVRLNLNNKNLFLYTKGTVPKTNVEVYIYLHFIDENEERYS